MPENANFLDAVKAGDLSRVKELLEADPSLVNTRGDSGESAILLSVYYRRNSVRDLLLARGAELNIYEAAAAGQLERVATLAKASPALANSYAPDGFTPLGLAAFFGQRTVVDALLAHGADVNAVSRNATGYTALTGAVAGGHKEIVGMLLAAGANATHRYVQGLTPLHEAAAGGKLEIAGLLLNHGADPNARADDNQTALAMAEAKGHTAVAALLRQHGAKA